ncbi:unnamed protein product [Bemisia tabaci]|uniref:C2H2-type domain-containing protein n=1 Tax=Bemisia tabaci TaxID=7038 RepID=A0A9P0CDI9_BEMTA|nr:unnamed protein product [Bemisia tabaci]
MIHLFTTNLQAQVLKLLPIVTFFFFWNFSSGLRWFGDRSLVEENDGLPNLICEHCLLNVDRSLKFKERCIRSDALLRSYLHYIVLKEKENSQPYIKTEIKSEPEEQDIDALHDSIDEDEDDEDDEDDDSCHQDIKEEQSEEVVMIVDPFSIHLDQYDDDMSEENQDSHLDYPVESSYGGSDVLRLSQEDPRRHSNCNICNLGFKNREQLDRHKQIHTAGPPYPCDYCDKSFDGRSDLKTHWETHKGDNQFMCEVCGASYAEEAILQAHSIIHERVRPYNCPTCSKSFYYRSDLRKHAIIHTDLSVPSNSGNDLSSLLIAEPNGSTRKRFRNPEEWKRNKLRKARNEGKEYVDRNMKVHAAKRCGEFIHNCRFHCNQNVPETVRQQIFTEFWSLGDWNIQTSYLCQLVILENVQRRKKKCPVYSKDVACKYFLNAQRVCKEFFRRTLDISHKRISYSIKKKKVSESGFLPPDKRGRGKPANKIPDSKVNLIKQHIKLFPRYTSDYSRHINPHLKYLSQYLTVTKMYNLYVDYCTERNSEPVTETFYRNTFNAQLNLHLQRPLEACLTCDKVELDIAYGSAIEMQQAIEQKEMHLQEMAIAKLDKELTIRTINSDHVVVCFSLQKILPSPSPACNKAYYARQLYLYNFCIHDLQSGDAIMYLWHEGLAGRGPEQIASCLYKFILSLPPHVTHITVFSNSTVQNKSTLLVKFWLYVIQNTQIKIINHKFLPFEHLANECDNDFITIDKWRRKSAAEIYIPTQWIHIISDHSKKYSFVEMTNQDFVSLDCLKPYFKDSVPDIDSMECFHLQQGSFTLFYKRAIAEKDFQMFNMKSDEIQSIPERLPFLLTSSNQHKIKFAKYRTLLGLLPHVPAAYHGFYLLLPHDDVDSNCENLLSIVDESRTSRFSFFYDTDEENGS